MNQFVLVAWDVLLLGAMLGMVVVTVVREERGWTIVFGIGAAAATVALILSAAS